MIWMLALAIFVALPALRRGAPLALASVGGIATWRSTHSLPATIASIAAVYATARWFFDAAANHAALRRASVAIEILVAGSLAGVVAVEIAGRHDPFAWHIAAGSSLTAMAIVARWRAIAL